MEYYISKKSSNGTFCLFRLIMPNSLEDAEKALRKCEEEFPNDEFKISKAKKEECWWNFGTD